MTDGTSGDGRPRGTKTETMNPTHVCGDEGSWVGQLVVSPHPEGEDDHGHQAYDGHQRVEQSAEELGLLGKRVGGGCRGRKFIKLWKINNTSDWPDIVLHHL